MPAPWPHVHVSEREVAHTWPDGRADDARWEDCLWASAVEWLNDTWADVPDTLAYAERLRAASGEPPTGPSTFDDLRRAAPVAVEPLGYAAFEVAMVPGSAGVAMGSLGHFVAGHRLRRYDPAYAGGHAVYVAHLDDGIWWWCDPLAPRGAYQGERVSRAEVRQFMGAWSGIVRPMRPRPATQPEPREASMAILYNEQLWDIAAGRPFFDAPRGTQLGTLSAAKRIRTIGAPMDTGEDASPSIDDWRAAILRTAALDGVLADKVVFVRRADLANPGDPQTADCSAAVETATAPLAATITDLRGALADRDARLGRIKDQALAARKRTVTARQEAEAARLILLALADD